MKVLQYLNDKYESLEDSVMCVNALSIEFGIKVSYNEEFDLYVLNYSQIDSPKFHDITRECRSLVIRFNYDTFEVVSLAFDRFFNHGEDLDYTDVRIDKLTAYEKLDGSLITVFWYNGRWLYRTKSMIMPVLQVNGFETTWKDIIEDGLDWDEWEIDNMCTQHSYIFEITSPENRVVVRYTGRNGVLLAVRNNHTGEYMNDKHCAIIAEMLSVDRPRRYKFNNIEELLASAKALPDLEEGYVMYTIYGRPILKLKNPAYVAAHHLRGEGLNPKRLMDLLIMNEVPEYLSVFPEDREIFAPYTEAFLEIFVAADMLFKDSCKLETQKEFAMAVKDSPTSGLLFAMRKGTDLYDAFNSLTTNSKYSLISAFMRGVDNGVT